MLSDNTICIDISDNRSTLIRKIEYDPYNMLLLVHFKNGYHLKQVLHEGVHPNHFDELINAVSIGKLYLGFIKPNFKQINYNTMGDASKRPNTKNSASNEVRWIDLSIDVNKINKDWIIAGKNGNYLAMKLRMLPDGEMDKFGNLGMIVQAVPTEIYKKAEAEKKGSGKDIKGEILGNAAELDWGNSNTEGTPGAIQGTVGGVPEEELPF